MSSTRFGTSGTNPDSVGRKLRGRSPAGDCPGEGVDRPAPADLRLGVERVLDERRQAVCAGKAEMDAVAREPGRLVHGECVPIEDAKRRMSLRRRSQFGVVASVQVSGCQASGQHVGGVGSIGQPEDPRDSLCLGFGHHEIDGVGDRRVVVARPSRPWPRRAGRRASSSSVAGRSWARSRTGPDNLRSRGDGSSRRRTSADRRCRRCREDRCRWSSSKPSPPSSSRRSGKRRVRRGEGWRQRPLGSN